MPETFPPYIPHWIGWVCALALAAGAGGYLLRLLRTIARDVTELVGALPVWLTIAREFEKNGGSSLRDAIDRIGDKADTAIAKSEFAAATAEANGKRVEEIGRLLAGLDEAALDMLGGLTVGHQEIKEAITAAGNGGPKP